MLAKMRLRTADVDAEKALKCDRISLLKIMWSEIRMLRTLASQSVDHQG